MKPKWLLLGLLLILLTACAGNAAPSKIEGGSISSGDGKTGSGNEKYFNVPVEQPGDPVGISFRGMLTGGTLRAELTDAEDRIVWQSEGGPGNFNTNVLLDDLPVGEYRLGIAWDGPFQGQYFLEWEPWAIPNPQVSPLALLAGLGMIAVAVAAGIYALRQGGCWTYLGLGALAWVVTVALKFAWAIPLNTPIYKAIVAALPQPLADILVYLYIGALTGLFEVLVLWPALRYTRWGKAPWTQALAFGIGFGAVEALLVGLQSALLVAAAWLMPAAFSSTQLQGLLVLNDPMYET